MTPNASESPLPPPITVPVRADELERLLGLEWLLANKAGAYASSTVVGCNTRRYHGLLVAADPPPGGRIVVLATVMEELEVGGATFALATNEFPGAFSPWGAAHLAEYRDGVVPTFVYRAGGAELTKEIILAETANAAAVRYVLRGAPGVLRVRPFVALRGYHELRRPGSPREFSSTAARGGVAVRDRRSTLPAAHLVSKEATYSPAAQWWERFRYRADLARGQEGLEDLYSPGCFTFRLADGGSCQFTASLGDPVPVGATTTLSRRRARLEKLAASVGPGAPEPMRRLAAATDAFVVRRPLPGAADSTTILAGFPWFADWGRDAFIALPGLLLCTGRFEAAREVFRTFGGRLGEGMIANRFDEFTQAAHYNSIDASLWYVVAAERYLAATGDRMFWRDELLPACEAILRAYRDGTRFDIHADADGLLTGGSARTQLTWMDAAVGGEVVTPRHGKAVEVNALWHSAHRILAERCRGIDDALADRYAHLADLIAPAFGRAFWNERGRCLYDCLTDGRADESIRPNQVLAVSLPHCPLPPDRQRDVVRTAAQHLLTPRGLRTLSPADPRYRGRYGGSWESRDRAYHQGTAWAWLMGPFIEAHLKAEGCTPFALAQAEQWLAAFDGHLYEAGLGYISEVFDGDPPHAPGGCIAQAWSVAEVLRAKLLVQAIKDDPAKAAELK